MKYHFLAAGVFSLTLSAIVAMLLTRGPAVMHILPNWVTIDCALGLLILGIACLIGYGAESIGQKWDEEHLA